MSRNTGIILGIMTVLCLQAGCMSHHLPEAFEEEAVKNHAQKVVRQLSRGDYDVVTAQFSEEMLGALDTEELKDTVMTFMDNLGTMEEIRSQLVAGGTNDTTGDYAIVVTKCTYTQGRAVFTICFDTRDKICGLYMK